MATGLLVLIEEVDGVGAAEAEIDGIDIDPGSSEMTEAKSLVPSGTHIRLVIWPPSWAIIQREAEHLGVGERIVLGQRRDFMIVLDVVDVFAEPLWICAPSRLKRKKFGAGLT